MSKIPKNNIHERFRPNGFMHIQENALIIVFRTTNSLVQEKKSWRYTLSKFQIDPVPTSSTDFNKQRLLWYCPLEGNVWSRHNFIYE